MATGDKNAQLVLKRWEDCDKALIEERRNFWLNLAFTEGHQWIQWNPRSNTVQHWTAADGDNTRTRIKVNKIQERVNQLVGRFCQRDLTFEGQPEAADEATVAGSRLGESILEACSFEQGWDELREEEVFYDLMGGTAAVSVEWNDPATIKQQAASGQVSGTSDVEVTVWSIAEFSVEGGSRNWRDARWWIGARAMPPAQVKAKYGLDFDPKPDALGSYSPLQRELLTGRRQDVEKDLTSVYVLYERPNAGCPKGRHMVVVNERCVVNEPWPFPFTDKLNLRVFRQMKSPVRWTGTTIVSEARGPQIAYNATMSTIVEHTKTVGNIRIMVPHGAFDDDTVLTDEAGEIVPYWPVEGASPGYMTPPELPRYIQNQLERLEAELDGILHTHAVSRGEAPGDRNSGLALSILAEKNDTPLGPMSRDQAKGWSEIGTMVLETYEAKATDKRTTVVRSGNNVPMKYEWNGSKLQGQTRVRVPLDATLPTSRAATQSMLISVAQSFPGFADMLSADPAMLARLLDLPGGKILGEIASPDVRWANMENEMLAAGEPRLPQAWEDHAVHMAQHNAFRKTKAFDAADDTVKEIFTAHLDAHQRLIEEEAMAQAALNATNPGFAALPQANEPIGSAVPPPAGGM